ncbi:hypothetical protein NE865_00628 [Phthorimaea operculella]|nr:hypothetical protein NE865_00628 [Phthorimaea operculella]
MDGSALEHSDSDSGESWTLLESGPVYGDDAPDFVDHPTREDGSPVDHLDKDEDTDGISIISDSEAESVTPCELTYEHCSLEEARPSAPHTPDLPANPVPPNKLERNESIREEDFLGDNTKLKTYVHKRNKRLSTVLNIIVLGSVITAAGVAIGHMWGVKNDCISNGPSVNKILSNLYKLQEENAFLRNKVRELTIINNYQLGRKTDIEKPPLKLHKCRKVFEESLTNKNADRLTKCVDNEDKPLDSHMLEFEKEFLSDIEKLKNVYQQNKSWLDVEITRRLKREGYNVNKSQNSLKSPKSIKINEETKTVKDDRVKGQTSEPPLNGEEIINVIEPLAPTVPASTEKKITYADSLKSVHKVVKRSSNELNTGNRIKDYIRKKRPIKKDDTIFENSSDEELQKDDRYIPHISKPERKKNDRQKTHKKQKRRNKYEQWEMKGGYMRDYDDFSITSSHENEYVLKKPDQNHFSKEFEKNNYINQFAEPVDIKKPIADDITVKNRTKGDKAKTKDLGWYEKRVALRKEARKKLEHELFGETSPSSAQWYFRRMQRREQCRIGKDNDTYKRLSKRLMNYKTKH